MIHYDVRGVRVPAMFYGTAWKEARTTALTGQALAAGFTAIDTAAQRKHYDEAAVGAALAAFPGRAGVFVQTKFTYQRGQDHRLPYDPTAPLATQVQQSFARSREHLGTIDALVLHGPWSGVGWSREDREVWAAMEALVDAGQVRLLGVSNASAAQVAELCASARLRPAFVQNRCYASRGWDREVRALCAASDMRYQAFSLLTANRAELSDGRVRRVATRTGRSVPEVAFAFALARGMIVLTGTSDPAHMRADLTADGVPLGEDDLDLLDGIGGA